MGILDQVIKGTLKVPDLMLIFGVDGVGKSTFAAGAPSPLFIGPEKGTARLNVQRLPSPKDFRDLAGQLNALWAEKHDYKTVVIDTVDWLEPMIWAQVCRDEGVSNIEQVGGGFAKGYIVALGYWQILRLALVKLQEERGLNVILLAHAEVKAFTDPQLNASYDRYVLKMHHKAAALLREWVDFVGFANYKTIAHGKATAAKQKAYGDGTRRLYTERRPAFDAKNRLGLPPEMEFSYEAYQAAATATPESKAAAIRENIQVLLADTRDEKAKTWVAEHLPKIGDNLTDLLKIQEKLRTKLKEEQDAAVTSN